MNVELAERLVKLKYSIKRRSDFYNSNEYLEYQKKQKEPKEVDLRILCRA